MINSCVRYAVLIASQLALSIYAMAASPNTFVTYSGDALPQNSVPAFELDFDSIGTPFVENGRLIIENPNSAGSIGYLRHDQTLGSDLAVFQLRTRFSPLGTPSALPSAVVQARWVGDEPGQFHFFVANGFVRLRGGSGPSFDGEFSIDTSVFHTYSVVKNRNVDVQLFIDGNLMLTRPFAQFSLSGSGATSLGAFQIFQGNPRSRTEWDFFRYAVGDDALNQIPVPEPSTASFLMAVAASALISRRRR